MIGLIWNFYSLLATSNCGPPTSSNSLKENNNLRYLCSHPSSNASIYGIVSHGVVKIKISTKESKLVFSEDHMWGSETSGFNDTRGSERFTEPNSCTAFNDSILIAENTTIRQINLQSKAVATVIQARGNSDGQFNSSTSSVGRIDCPHFLHSINMTHVVAVQCNGYIRLINMEDRFISTIVMEPLHWMNFFMNIGGTGFYGTSADETELKYSVYYMDIQQLMNGNISTVASYPLTFDPKKSSNADYNRTVLMVTNGQGADMGFGLLLPAKGPDVAYFINTTDFSTKRVTGRQPNAFLKINDVILTIFSKGQTSDVELGVFIWNDNVLTATNQTTNNQSTATSSNAGFTAESKTSSRLNVSVSAQTPATTKSIDSSSLAAQAHPVCKHFVRDNSTCCRFTKVIEWPNLDSQSSCGIQCYRTNGCVAYKYEPSGGKCELYGTDENKTTVCTDVTTCYRLTV